MKKGNRPTSWVISQPSKEQIVGSCVAPTALKPELREFGFIPDFGAWHPGDIILTSSSAPDWVSQKIEDLQATGYGAKLAKWTHAAIYLGDELMLCEAQLDPLGGVCRVIVTPVEEYILTHSILVKRSIHARRKLRGWAIATSAASKIGGHYDWEFVANFALEWIRERDSTLLKDKRHLATRDAFICSSLYSTAHCYVTDISIDDKRNGICLPAYLAGTKHLDTVDFGWIKLE